jgi:hypothetical protein
MGLLPFRSPTASKLVHCSTVMGFDRHDTTCTKDDTLVLASEVGVLEYSADKIQSKAACSREECCWWITEEGRIVSDEEIKERIAQGASVPRMAEQARCLGR